MIRKRNDAIAYLNLLGREKRPFLFFTNFEATHAYVSPLPLSDPNVLFAFGDHTNARFPVVRELIDLEVSPISFEVFKPAFEHVVGEIKVGNSFLTNLTFSTPVHSDFSLLDIFQVSHARFKLLVHNQFVCFSPEPFVSISNQGEISSFPMKGTIDASVHNAEELLLNDAKEIAEHVTIVDLIRNDLSQVANKVHVPNFRYLEKVKSRGKLLYQTSSEVSGQLSSSWKNQIGDILFKLLPAGSISGAPKPKTMEIIRQYENHDRNFYTGVCGLFNGESLISGVMIRFIEQTPEGLFYKSGAGITAKSDPEKEYQEILDKIYVPVS